MAAGERVVNNLRRQAQVAKKMLSKCDALFATCNVVESSSLHCKVQSRVTWPLILKITRATADVIALK